MNTELNRIVGGELARLRDPQARPPLQETVPAGTTHSTGWPVTLLMRSKSAS
jgi:hypothetical protein